MEQWTGSKLGREYDTCLFNIYAEGCAVHSHSAVSDTLQPHGLQATRLLCPWRFFRQEYWSGLPYLPPGDLPNLGIEPRSPALQVDGFFTDWATRDALYAEYIMQNARLDESQAESRLQGEIATTSDMQMIPL